MSLPGYRKNRRPGNRAMTTAEAAYVSRVKRAGCLACLSLGYSHDEDGPMVEGHHTLSGGIRRGHMYVVGICAYHHRDQPYLTDEAGMVRDRAWHRKHLGPSLQEEEIAFHEQFGDDDALLAMQNQLIDERGTK